jgi:hypothetical protein
VTFPEGTASFNLGAAASKWAEKIRHPPSRLEKIGVRQQWRASAIGVEDRAFLKELEGAVAQLTIGRLVNARFGEVMRHSQFWRRRAVHQ